MATLIAPPTETSAGLLDQAKALEADVERWLEPEDKPGGSGDLWELFDALEKCALGLAKRADWKDHALARELLICVSDLRRAILDDPEDKSWSQRAALQRMHVVVSAMQRRLEHEFIDDADEAARFVVESLPTVGAEEVGMLLGMSRQAIENWRAKRVSHVRKHIQSRVVLVAQLTYELLNTMTPVGVVAWFYARREQFGNRTPLQLIEEDVQTARGKLVSLARGGRGQLDV